MGLQIHGLDAWDGMGLQIRGLDARDMITDYRCIKNCLGHGITDS